MKLGFDTIYTLNIAIDYAQKLQIEEKLDNAIQCVIQ